MMIRHAVSIGVDVVSSFGYGRRLRTLHAAAGDARALALVARARGFTTNVLANQDATSAHVREEIVSAAALLRGGDTFLLAFNGHGLAGDTPYGFQQSWCLHDEPLVRFGKEGLDALLARFRAGVRVLVIANCCHSGIHRGRTRPTPAVHAHVVRISACAAADIALDWPDDSRPSPFANSFIHAARRDEDGLLGLFARIAATAGGLPQLEIGEPRSEEFLRDGF